MSTSGFIFPPPSDHTLFYNPKSQTQHTRYKVERKKTDVYCGRCCLKKQQLLDFLKVVKTR